MSYVPGVRTPVTNPESNGTPDNPIPASALRVTDYNPHLKLNNGMEIPGGRATCIGRKNVLWLHIPESSGHNVGTIAVLFGNPENTSRIEYWTFDSHEPEVFEGYTTLTTIETEASGNLTVRLEIPMEPR